MCRLTSLANLDEFSCSADLTLGIRPLRRQRHGILLHDVDEDPRASTHLHLEESKDGDRDPPSWKVFHLELVR